MFRCYVKYYDFQTKQWTEVKNFQRPFPNKSILDETHDETRLFLGLSEREQAFVPFTRFIIQIDEVDGGGNIVDTRKLYRVVDTDKVTQRKFVPPYLYDHEIRLLAAEKELERWNVDNLSFTNTFASLYTYKNALVDYDMTWTDAQWTPQFFKPRYVKDTMAELGVAPDEPDLAVSIIPPYNQNYVKDTSLNIVAPTTYPKVIVVSQFAINQVYGRPQFEMTYELTKITLLWPNGNSQIVTAGDEISLTQLGNVTIKYDFDIRTKMTNLSMGKVLFNEVSNKAWISYTMSVTQAAHEPALITIYDVVNRLVQTTPTRFRSRISSESSDENLPRYSLASGMLEKYGKVAAPEFIFTNKNLWECLVLTAAYVNAIPYLKIESDYSWTTIDFRPLSSEEPVAADVATEYVASTHQYDSDNYTAKLDCYVDNLVGGAMFDPMMRVGRSYRSETVEISEDSMVIPTFFPVYKITHIWFDNGGTLVDITNYILAKQVYDAIPGYPQTDSDTFWKGFRLYFTPGKKNIDGLTYKVSSNKWTAASNKIAIKNVLAAGQGLPIGSEANFNIGTNRFVVEYIPFINSRVQVYKTNAPEMGIVGGMYQSQSMNVVDFAALSKNLLSTINRTGNRSDEDSFKVFHLKDLPVIGQRTSDRYFVNSVTTEYGKTNLLGTITYVKDYQKISSYVNINSEQRYYEISENQSIDRYVNTDVFYLFDTKTIPEKFSAESLNPDNQTSVSKLNVGKNYLAMLLNKFADPKTIGGVQRYPRINSSHISIWGYAVDASTGAKTLQEVAVVIKPTTTKTGGNVIVLETDLGEDNYGAGEMSTEYTTAEETDGFVSKQYRYSDEDGYIDWLEISNLTDYDADYSGGGVPADFGRQLPFVDDNDIDYLEWVDNPLQTTGQCHVKHLGAVQKILVFKDSREVLKLRQQFHFLTRDSSIVIGEAMVNKCRFIQDMPNFSCKVVFLRDYVDTYEFKIKPADIIGSYDITPANVGTLLSSEEAYIPDSLEIVPYYSSTQSAAGVYPTTYTEPCLAWAILTEDNELIIAHNEIRPVMPGGKLTPIYHKPTNNY